MAVFIFYKTNQHEAKFMHENEKTPQPHSLMKIGQHAAYRSIIDGKGDHLRVKLIIFIEIMYELSIFDVSK